MKDSLLASYSGCPDNVTFYLQDIDAITPDKHDWFYDAMKSDRLRFTFDGGLRALRVKGKHNEILVIPVDNPLEDIPDVTFFKSEHGNYHLGRSIADKDDYKLLIKLNKGDYKYFQDDFFFLAIRVSTKDEKKDYTLYVSKKEHTGNPPRAQQD